MKISLRFFFRFLFSILCFVFSLGSPVCAMDACTSIDETLGVKNPLFSSMLEYVSSPAVFARTINTDKDMSSTTYTGTNILLETHHEKQELSLSCEANSMTELYNFIRAKEDKYLVTESFIRSKIIRSESLPMQVGKNEILWGDPDWYFVGDIYGKQSSVISRMSGYGIHARGIHRRVKDIFDRMWYELRIVPRSNQIILDSLSVGYPVMVYYISTLYPDNTPYFLDWKTATGKSIRWYIGEHTALIIGARTDDNGNITELTLSEWRSEAPVIISFQEWSERSRWFPEYIVATPKLSGEPIKNTSN